MEPQNKEKEFEKAIELYGGIITKICYYFSVNTDEFNDLRQEVLFNIWKGWDDFRNAAKLSTWIYRVSFNTCVSYNRKVSKNKNNISIDDVINLAAEEDSNKLEKYNEMHSLIQKLNYEDLALILMWLDEKSYEEMSDLMGLNRNTLAVRIKRIKEKIIKLSGK